jgi:hypothetical protein
MLIAYSSQGGRAFAGAQHTITDQLCDCVGDLDVERQSSHGSNKEGSKRCLTNGKTINLWRLA